MNLDWSLRAQLKYLPHVFAFGLLIVAVSYAQKHLIGFEQW